MEEQTKTNEEYDAVLKLCGIDEDEVREKCGDLIRAEGNPLVKLEYDRANGNEVILSIHAVPEGELSARKVAKPVIKEFKNVFGEKIYSMEADKTLEEVVVELLKENTLTISTAESLTGGLFSARLVNVPGASGVFKEGFITYSNKAKRKYAGVKKGTLLKYTAVSDEVVREMAKGAAVEAKADCAVAITGLAGPDGGTDKKPVGTVYVACWIDGNTLSKECHFTGTRQEIRQASVTAALVLLRECLLRYFSEMTFGNGDNKKKK